MTKVKGLLVMDVDSTLIQEEGIDLLGQAAGLGEKIAAITEQAMQGELDFKQALAERVALLKGQPESLLTEILPRLHFTPGAEALIAELHKRAYKVGLVSGGFHETVDLLAQRAGVDYVTANRLEIKDGFLTGRLLGEIVTKDIKAAKLRCWAAENKLTLSQTVAVGDGANDLLMLKTAGIGIAFCAKPIVREQAAYRIDDADLYKVIDILDEVNL
ncbi:phosphoserine phosphatase SerB [Streptococcus sp. H49]|uniref:phosphoserine phosphatase SerB n=1 Tax=Streptococcus huangxiaojuni TaxID=3237239 RepID=UPI0034A3EC5E